MALSPTLNVRKASSQTLITIPIPTANSKTYDITFHDCHIVNLGIGVGVGVGVGVGFDCGEMSCSMKHQGIRFVAVYRHMYII
ncbi:hypothetical protein ADUPG1_007387, partial [Aduncisulcus paluster]